MNTKQWDPLTQLRGLLGQKPSSWGFTKMLALFEEWQDKDEQELGLQYAEAHLRSWPDALRIGAVERHWPGFPRGAPTPSFRLVRTISFRMRPFDDALRRLLLSPHISHITHLHFHNVRLGDEGVRWLVSSLPLQELSSLELVGAHIGPRGAEALVSTKQFNNLQELQLSHNGIGDEGAELIARTIDLPQLREFDLQLNGIGNRGALALASTHRLHSLHTLALEHNHVTEGGHRALGFSKHLSTSARRPFLRSLSYTSLSHACQERGLYQEGLPREELITLLLK